MLSVGVSGVTQTECERVAGSWHLHSLQHIVETEHCELTAELITSCVTSAENVAYLLSKQCPHVPRLLAQKSVAVGRADTLQCLADCGVWAGVTAAEATDLLQEAGCCSLPCAKWLKQNGAAWPEMLGGDLEEDEVQWMRTAVLWAQSEGCTAPVFTSEETATSEDDGSENESDTDNSDRSACWDAGTYHGDDDSEHSEGSRGWW